MSDLNQFVTDAIKTESKIDKVVVNEALLNETIRIMVHAGNILDQIKKHVFYGKPYNTEAFLEHNVQLGYAIRALSSIPLEQIEDEEVELKVNPRLFHAIVGISTESTELLEALDIKGEKMDNVNIAEELGDIDWYKAIGVNELGISWDTILETVIEKLKARFPNKFTSEDAINRDLEKERDILNKMDTN
jgi:NTP pyrophosphatase (non-canonical NTP hydrolase)